VVVVLTQQDKQVVLVVVAVMVLVELRHLAKVMLGELPAIIELVVVVVESLLLVCRTRWFLTLVMVVLELL
jgi:hypothetical protein